MTVRAEGHLENDNYPQLITIRDRLPPTGHHAIVDYTIAPDTRSERARLCENLRRHDLSKHLTLKPFIEILHHLAYPCLSLFRRFTNPIPDFFEKSLANHVSRPEK